MSPPVEPAPPRETRALPAQGEGGGRALGRRLVPRDVEEAVNEHLGHGQGSTTPSPPPMPFGHLWGPYLPWFGGKWWIGQDRGDRRSREATKVSKAARATAEATRVQAERLSTRAATVREVVLSRRGVRLQSVPLRIEARLALGIGSPHPEGMGMSFSYPHGTPRIPGSSLKGVLRAAADRVRRDGPPPGTDEGVEIDDEVCRQLFGWAPEAGNGAELDAPEEGTSLSQRGHLWVLDAYPHLEVSKDEDPASRQLVELDVVTPHHSGYFTGSGPPVETESPTPVLYPVVAAGALLDVDVLHVGCCVGGRDRCDAVVGLLWQTVCYSGAIGARSALGLGVVALREDPVLPRVEDGERDPMQQFDEAVATERPASDPPELLSLWLGRLEVGGDAEPALREVLARLAAQFEGNPAGLTELVVARAVLDAIEGGDERLGTPEVLDKLQDLLDQQGLWLPDPPQARKPYKQRRAKGHELSLRLRALRGE